MAFHHLFCNTMKHVILAALLAMTLPVFAQTKKALDHADVHRWRKIEQSRLSNNGQYAVWLQTPVTEGDSEVHLWSAATGTTQIFARGSEPQFSDDSKWLVFRIKPALDTLKALRRKKVKDEDIINSINSMINFRSEKPETGKNCTFEILCRSGKMERLYGLSD